MLGHRVMTIHDYVEMLKRRVWLILISAAVFLAIGVALTHVIRPRYVSQTLVLIEQQKVPEDYVKPVVSEDLGERLASMKEQILSRSRIEPIVDRFNLFAANNRTMDDRIDLTRKSIEIMPIRSDQARGMPGFFISFKAQDARIAQQVCGEITSLFVSENLSDREQSAEGTTDFLKQQLADAKRNLDDQDAKLADFQRKYIGKLPEQGPANANTLQALTTELDSANQSLSRLQQEETFQQAMITQQTHDLQRNEPAAVVAGDERKAELRTLLAKKQELETLYTPDHPDVVAITHQISDLEAEMNAAPPPAPVSAPVNRPDTPQLQQLKAQLRATQQAIASARLQQSRIQSQVGMYESRIEASPTVEEEYKQITRDHDTALQFYNTLLTKMNESSMATALEHRQQGEQFKVMDAPNLPDSPTFPKPIVFAGGGLAFGLFLGLGISALLEFRDKSLRNERDIWAFTKLPTLAVISNIAALPQPVKPRINWWPFSRLNKPAESTRG